MLSCPLTWSFPVCSWLSQELSQMALEPCVKMNWALKSCGKDMSSPVSLPCACLCPAHRLHEDDWGCLHTRSWGHGTERTTFLCGWRGSLPPHCTWRRNGWLVLCFLPALLAPWERQSPGMWLLSLPPGQGDADKTRSCPVAPEMVSEHQALPVSSCLQPFALPSLQEPPLTHKELPRPTTAKTVFSAEFYASSGLPALLILFCRYLSRNHQFSSLLRIWEPFLGALPSAQWY